MKGKRESKARRVRAVKKSNKINVKNFRRTGGYLGL